MRDTIAAIATAPGPSGIAVVRVSGPASLEVADRLFIHGRTESNRAPSSHAGGTFLHGFIRPAETMADGRSDPVDEVILLIYRAPRSYTREDAVEIQTHGGRLSAQRVLRQVLACGVRLSEPGEFTQRAFINGRIDLTQAEAVMDLISAACDRAATSAVLQLRGDLRSSLEAIYDRLVDSLSAIETSLDFVDDDVPDSIIAGGSASLSEAIRIAERLASTWEEGRVLREGKRVVIAGRPNVGKSTLLNALLGHQRAIVSHIPGTTRDTIEETLIVAGLPAHVVDTAGLRASTCPVEEEGVRRTRLAVEKADIVLYVVDGSAELSTDDVENLHRLLDPGGDGHRPDVLVVLNKQDLGTATTPSHVAALGSVSCVACSLLDPRGVEPVVRGLERLLGSLADGPPHAVISERHYRGLVVALAHLRDAGNLLRGRSEETPDQADDGVVSASVSGTGSASGAAMDLPSFSSAAMRGLGRDPSECPILAAVHLRTALDELGQLLGKTYTADLLDRVFARFCIGK